MKTNYLFPTKCKTIGWILIVIGLAITLCENWDLLPQLGPTKVISLIPEQGSCDQHYSFITTNNSWADEIGHVTLMLGFILVSFTRLKEEDEYTINLRMKSLSWVVKAYGLLYILVELTVYGGGYLLPFFLFHWLIFPLFIIKFHYEMWKFRKEVVNDEE